MKKNKWFLKCLVVLAIIGGIGYSIPTIQDQDLYATLIRLSIIPVMLAPWIVKKLFQVKISDNLETIYIIFVFFAHFLGSIVNLYHIIPSYDKVMHFLSGVLSALLGFIILIKMNHYQKKKIWFNILFIIAITLSIAALWEFYEFIFDQLFARDAQNVLTTGTGDTMMDMIMAFIGSIFVSISYWCETKKKKKFIVTDFISEIEA